MCTLLCVAYHCGVTMVRRKKSRGENLIFSPLLLYYVGIGYQMSLMLTLR